MTIRRCLFRELFLPRALHVVEDEGDEVDLRRLGLGSGPRGVVGDALTAQPAADQSATDEEEGSHEQHDPPESAAQKPWNEKEEAADPPARLGGPLLLSAPIDEIRRSRVRGPSADG